jgi:hypothetical protein
MPASKACIDAISYGKDSDNSVNDRLKGLTIAEVSWHMNGRVLGETFLWKGDGGTKFQTLCSRENNNTYMIMPKFVLED